MKTGIYQIANTLVEIRSMHDDVQKLCQDYAAEGVPEFVIETTQADIRYEQRKAVEEARLEGLRICLYPSGYLETLAVYRKLAVLLLDRDTLLFHGSVIVVEGQAYLFTASSGTGKTTHTRLWLKNVPGAYVLNGDKPLLQLTAQGALACGTPWQGKEGYGVNKQAPLKAICILERSSTNQIVPIPQREAMPMLFQQSYRPNNAVAMKKTMELIGRLSQTVSLYRLGCNMTDEAALVAYNGMK